MLGDGNTSTLLRDRTFVSTKETKNYRGMELLSTVGQNEPHIMFRTIEWEPC